MSDPAVYGGRGIMFAVFDTIEDTVHGPHSAPRIVAQAIQQTGMLDEEQSLALARHLTTTTFPLLKGRTSRFNSIVKAGDVVGARLIPKLMGALRQLHTHQASASAAERAVAAARAQGFAEAISIISNPFAVEAEEESNTVDWDVVQHYARLLHHSDPRWQDIQNSEVSQGEDDDLQ